MPPSGRLREPMHVTCITHGIQTSSVALTASPPIRAPVSDAHSVGSWFILCGFSAVIVRYRISMSVSILQIIDVCVYVCMLYEFTGTWK